MSETGLSPDPQEYRRRLDGQPDAQVDAWAIELMRDVSISRGVRRVLADFRKATGLSDRELERVYAAGGGPPATVGRTVEGELMVPAIALHCLVPGLHAQVKDARGRLIGYLVENFDEIVYT
ncbi:MAG TPA: hypothetical protein VEI48_02020 [Candidatus Sulfotelmatobacter sp.]|nr:hypothetical protein [Candidatus Sulfotelmatobacter sp.]